MFVERPIEYTRQTCLHSANLLFPEVPIIVGGDFNLVRDSSEKSTKNVNNSLVNLFNQFVSDVSLREMHRHGGTYTWTNK